MNLKYYNYPGIVALGALALLGTAMLMPRVNSSAHATEQCTVSGTTVDCDATTTIETYAVVAPVVSLGVQSNVIMDVTPKNSGSTLEQPVSVSVATNSSEGYALYLKALGTADSQPTNALISTDASNTNIIAPVEGGENGVDINTLATQGNVWGYNIASTTSNDTDKLYQAVPTEQTPIRITDSTESLNEIDNLELTFGLHVDTGLPAGVYSNTIMVSVVANPITVHNLAGLTYMQEMTSEICENTPMHTTKQLTDTRDGKKYWVAKLRDGNCWMTQNLALDLSTEKTLTPADTNVTTDFTPDYNTRTDDTASKPQTSPAFSTDYYAYYFYAFSWGRLKNYVINDPLNTTGCGSLTYAQDLCSSRFTDVSGSNWQSTFTAQTLGDSGQSEFTAIDPTTQTYDAHYLVGNYYTTTAAVTNGGTICPKGWTLPQIDGNNGTFANLLKGYGLISGVSSVRNAYEVYLKGNSSTAFYVVEENQFNVAGPPLYLVHGGAVDMHYSGYLDSAGSSASYQTKSSYSGNTGMWYAFTASPTIRANLSWRSNGFTMRCLAQ